jgi:hypothetical protein
MKLHASKIFRKEYGSSGAKSIISVIGDIPYGRMAMQRIERAFEEMKPEEMTIRGLRDVIEDQIVDIHSVHIHPHPDRERVGFDLLIGLWSDVDKKLAMFSTHDTAINQLFGYTCFGVGEYLAHFVIRPKWIPPITCETIRPIAIKALDSVKGFVDGCGGFTDVIVLRSDGKLGQVERI